MWIAPVLLHANLTTHPGGPWERNQIRPGWPSRLWPAAHNSSLWTGICPQTGWEGRTEALLSGVRLLDKTLESYGAGCCKGLRD